MMTSKCEFIINPTMLNKDQSAFFLVCPIGLEKYLFQEFEYKWKLHFPNEEFRLIEMAQGGIEIETKLDYGLALNEILKTPSKILLRLKSQKCRDLPKFYNIIKKFKWKEILTAQEVDLSISCHKSRLFHTGKIENSFHKGMNDYFNANKISKKVLEKFKDAPKQKIFIRLVEDQLTLSLDTSGELLHIRKNRKFRGHAPIRENMASLLLMALQGLELPDNYSLIDPMCGTGTLLNEAKDFCTLSKRDFYYHYLNESFYQKIDLEEKANVWNYKKLLGFDIDEEIVKNNETQDIEYQVQDLFKSEALKGDHVVIINPPYGKRVAIKGSPTKYFKDLIKRVRETYSPKLFGLIIPSEYLNDIKADEKISFSQNGIKVCFLVFRN